MRILGKNQTSDPEQEFFEQKAQQLRETSVIEDLTRVGQNVDAANRGSFTHPVQLCKLASFTVL